MASTVPVLYSDLSYAFSANREQAQKLLKTECARADSQDTTEREDDPKSVRYLVLSVDLRVARAAMDRVHPLKARGITRVKQDPGSGRWVQRADMAGRGAGSLAPTTIHFKLGHVEATA